MKTTELAGPDPWQSLTRWTPARIAIGHAGASMPTRANLDFQKDHALARDVIYTKLDTDGLAKRVKQVGFSVALARSVAQDRREYLLRPDLGRILAPECIANLKQAKSADGLLTIVVADGLSSMAAERNAVPLLEQLQQGVQGWTLDTVVIATQARVALGDAIGQLRGAEAVLVLIGERPGLSSPDSLGAYLTYAPQVGRTDAERNCVSNIRVGGLSAEVAGERLARLLEGARRLKASGIVLKDTYGEDETLSTGQNSLS